MLILFFISGCYIIHAKKISLNNGKKLMYFCFFIVIDEMITLSYTPYPLLPNTLIILLIRIFSLSIIMDNIEPIQFIKKYTDIMMVISLISLICFLIIHLANIDLPFCSSYKDGFYGSFYFRVNEYTRPLATRNAGPYNEPGVFACYLSIALMFQLFSDSPKHPMHGWNGIKSLIIAITLLTTLSGTGLLCFVIVLSAYIFHNGRKTNILKNPIIILSLIIMFLGFCYAEITYGVLTNKLFRRGGSYGDRMSDTIVGYRLAFKHFFWGTGITNDYSTAWRGVSLANSRSNGFANLAAATGIPFTIYYIYRIKVQAKKFIKNNTFYIGVFIIVLFAIYNTQPIVFQTIGLSFLFDWGNRKQERGSISDD